MFPKISKQSLLIVHKISAQGGWSSHQLCCDDKYDLKFIQA